MRSRPSGIPASPFGNTSILFGCTREFQPPSAQARRSSHGMANMQNSPQASPVLVSCNLPFAQRITRRVTNSHSDVDPAALPGYYNHAPDCQCDYNASASSSCRRLFPESPRAPNISYVGKRTSLAFWAGGEVIVGCIHALLNFTAKQPDRLEAWARACFATPASCALPSCGRFDQPFASYYCQGLS